MQKFYSLHQNLRAGDRRSDKYYNRNNNGNYKSSEKNIKILSDIFKGYIYNCPKNKLQTPKIAATESDDVMFWHFVKTQVIYEKVVKAKS